jgi:hypothetical protein
MAGPFNRRLRQFGDDLRSLFQRPGERGTAADKSQAAVGQRVFGNVVGVRSLDYLHQIVFAGVEKDLLDFAATLQNHSCRSIRGKWSSPFDLFFRG